MSKPMSDAGTVSAIAMLGSNGVKLEMREIDAYLSLSREVASVGFLPPERRKMADDLLSALKARVVRT